MARRKHVVHDYGADQRKEESSRIKFRNKPKDQSRTTCAKVRMTFLLSYDRYIVSSDADNLIMKGGEKEEKEIIYSYIQWVYFQHDSIYRHIWILPIV
jgi:hypothetical protein